MWLTRDVDAPTERAWDLLVDVREWPRWGPTVASAELDGGGSRLGVASTGRVRPPVGPALPFTVTEFDEGRRWVWRVAGVPATAHRVEPLGEGRCRVGIAVPLPFVAYAPVCRLALRRIDTLLRP